MPRTPGAPTWGYVLGRLDPLKTLHPKQRRAIEKVEALLAKELRSSARQHDKRKGVRFGMKFARQLHSRRKIA